MDKNFGLKVNDVVQLSPNVSNKMFACCFMIVSELKPFGAQGYVQNAGSKGQAYYRANWDEMEFIGNAIWSVNDNEEKNEPI